MMKRGLNFKLTIYMGSASEMLDLKEPITQN